MKPEDPTFQEMILKLIESKKLPVNVAFFGTLIAQPLLTNQQTADFFLINVKTLYNWRANWLVSKKIRRRHFYLWADLFDYLNRM